jgi:hypothetical protein
MESCTPLDLAIQDWVNHVSYAKAAKKHGVSQTALRKAIRDGKISQVEPERRTGSIVDEFASRARSVLWRIDRGKKKNYEKWQERVSWWASIPGGGLTKKQAIVRASKEFPALTKLFDEYDLSMFDTSDPNENVANQGSTPGAVEVVCENVEMSYRDCLRWAASAAGTKLRSGVEPHRCPNDTCFYLYRMAIEEPKDFMGKLSQLESKVDKEEEGRQNRRKEARLSAEEIHSYLETLKEESYEENS